MELQLENLNNCIACFINSALQLLLKTRYAEYILTNKTYIQHKKVSKALLDIFTGRETSVIKLRHLISVETGKWFYNNNSQQDSAEFLEDLEAALSKELESEAFREIQHFHWGSEKNF